MAELLAVIDATFKDNLENLTLHRMPGALPFGGKFRLIDFTLSNMRNSNITNVAIFPYGNYRSLQDHVGSGKRWDLDRRKDGLFILPPKNLYILPGNMITFQRMYEHIEFFKRSRQEYALITPASIVWNIDFNKVLENHIESGKDITEVMHQNSRIKTYILSKKLLIEFINNYDNLEYRTMLDVVSRKPGIELNIYKHQNYTRQISDTHTYLKSNLDLLKFDIGKTIFKPEAPIFSKEKTAPPAKYLSNARIENSMVSSGSIIDGTIIRSIIGRNVVVKKGAIIKNSYVMANSFIEEDAHLEYVILDKQTVVKKDTLITGTLNNPYISQKEQIVNNYQRLNVLMVASESYPFIKTGGLADIIGGLSRNLIRVGMAVTVVIPLYSKIKEDFNESLKREFSSVILYGDEEYKVTIYSYIYKKVKYYFIESFAFFDKEDVYGYQNDTDRFAFFNKAVVDLLDEFGNFDLVHIHDWHTSLIPILLDNSKHQNLKTLLSLHNIEYQGKANNQIIRKLGIKNFIYRDETINFLEIGINTATKIATVSPTYKEELKYEYYGKNLTHFILHRERDFYGILNGISSSLHPDRDKLIYSNYNVDSIDEKFDNKLFLQDLMGLKKDQDIFVLGMVTRIVEQKGFDLILAVIDEIIQTTGIQFILLGTGQKEYVDALQKLEERHPEQVKCNLEYDATVPNYIYAGADAFLMPSRFEPCGLGQMIALKYGTLPIVRDTGGLSDTVFNYDPITKKGNGFKFYHYDAHEMKNTIYQAIDIYTNHFDEWRQMQRRAMKSNYSLKRSAQKYFELYKTIVESSK